MLKHLFALFILIQTGTSGISQDIFCPEIDSMAQLSKSYFPFGVASGDPKENSVVIWTALFETSNAVETVQWEISADTNFTKILKRGSVSPESSKGYSIKNTVTGLPSGMKLFYRFLYKKQYSPIGRTKTAAQEAQVLRLAMVSCSSYELGYYNAYRLLSREKDLDAIIHLGDYIYEYQPGKYQQKKLTRDHIPAKEIISLNDYRSRYAQYRLDPDLAELHRLYPFITIWDDHEIANDTYVEGAKNHQPEADGDWKTRKQVARQVYFEWLPVEDNPEKSIIRKFKYGNLAELFMLDGRLEGRSKQAENTSDPIVLDSSRTMLGAQQSKWLIDGVNSSTAKWKIIGNQVIFSPYNYPEQLKSYPKSMDVWDGYPVERNKIMQAWKAAGSKNIVILTGDVHVSMGFNLQSSPNDSSGSIGAEWVTPSVTSSNYDEYNNAEEVTATEKMFKENGLNPHLNFLDLSNHGYVLLTFNSKEASANWKFVETVLKKSDNIKSEKTLRRTAQ